MFRTWNCWLLTLPWGLETFLPIFNASMTLLITITEMEDCRRTWPYSLWMHVTCISSPKLCFAEKHSITTHRFANAWMNLYVLLARGTLTQSRHWSRNILEPGGSWCIRTTRRGAELKVENHRKYELVVDPVEHLLYPMPHCWVRY